MHKKILVACMAIAAFAVFAASSASAAHLRESNTTGVTLGAGASITVANVGNVLFTGGLNVTCTSVHMSGTVTKDENGTIAAEIPALNPVLKGTDVNEDCTSALGPTKWTVNSKLCLHIPANTDNATITGCGVNVTFSLNVTGATTCKYSTANIAAVITTDKLELPKDAEVNISSQPLAKEEGSFLCPSTAQLDVEIVLTTTSGATLVFTEK